MKDETKKWLEYADDKPSIESLQRSVRKNGY